MIIMNNKDLRQVGIQELEKEMYNSNRKRYCNIKSQSRGISKKIRIERDKVYRIDNNINLKKNWSIKKEKIKIKYPL